MTPAPGRATRAARSSAAVVAAVLVALAAHLAGGGAPPPPVLLAAVVALVWPVALLLVGRLPSLPRQAAVVGVAQALLHGLFALGTPSSTAVDPMAGMHGTPMPLTAPMHHGASMWWAHAAAWAVTVLAWRFGEAAVGRLLERLPIGVLLALLAAHRDRGPPLPA